MLTIHPNFISQQQSTQPTNRASQSLIQLTNPNINHNQRIPNAVGILQPNTNMGGARGPRPLDQVTCYKVPLDFMHKCGVLAKFLNCTKFLISTFVSYSVVKRAIMQTNALKDTWPS